MKLTDFFNYVDEIKYNFDQLIFWTDDLCFDYETFFNNSKQFKQFYHVAVFLNDNDCDGMKLSEAYEWYCEYCKNRSIKPLSKKWFKDRCICLYHSVEKRRGVLTIHHHDETK